MINLSETETEYLVRIPASQKERAKSVPDRKWDPIRKAWVYPRRADIYDALMREFRRDAESIQITQPESDAKHEPPSRPVVPLDPRAKDRNDSGEAQIKKMKEENECYRGRIRELETSLKEASSELAMLRDRNVLQTPRCLEDEFVRLALESTGNDRVFELTLKRMPPDSTFPIEFCKLLRHILGEMLGSGDTERSLHELLVEVRNNKSLPDEAINLAHAIRRQRNVFAHEQIDGPARRMRVLFVLSAASLLWPHLGKTHVR